MLAGGQGTTWGLALLLLLLAAGAAARDDLYAVHSPDGRLVVAVGEHGAIRVSRDGGASWQSAEAPPELALTSVSLADARHGWAVGMGGALLRTEDGGATWTRQPLPEGSPAVHLLGVHALDAQRALAVGSWGSRLRSDDGGRSWRDAPLVIGPEHPRFAWLDPAERARVRRGGSVREDVALQSVTCLRGGEPGRERCWLVGEFGTVLRSEDGGHSWSAGEIRAGAPAAEWPFAAGESALAAQAEPAALVAALARHPSATLEIEAFASGGEIARLVSATDATPLFDLLEARIEAVRAALEAAGAAPGRLRSAGSPPWETADFGRSDPQILAGYLEARRAPEPRARVSLRLRPLLYDVAFADAERGTAVGLGGTVLRSEDGGRSWRPVDSGLEAALYAVVRDAGGELAVGERGVAWRAPSAGAGATGAEISPRGAFLRDLFAAPGAAGLRFAVGEGGLVLRSRDGGERWEPVRGGPG